MIEVSCIMSSWLWMNFVKSEKKNAMSSLVRRKGTFSFHRLEVERLG